MVRDAGKPWPAADAEHAIVLRTDAKGRPLVFELTGGEAHEVKGYDTVMERCEAQPEKLLGDKGYDADER